MEQERWSLLVDKAHNEVLRIHWSTVVSKDGFLLTSAVPVPPRLDLVRIVRIGLRMQKTGLKSQDRAAARP